MYEFGVFLVRLTDSMGEVLVSRAVRDKDQVIQMVHNMNMSPYFRVEVRWWNCTDLEAEMTLVNSGRDIPQSPNFELCKERWIENIPDTKPKMRYLHDCIMQRGHEGSHCCKAGCRWNWTRDEEYTMLYPLPHNSER